MRTSAFTIAIVLPLFCAPAARAADIRVPEDFPTIQAAIAAASSGDHIVVGPGTYPGGIDLLGKVLVVRSTGGAGATTIDAAGIGRAVRVASGEGLGTRIDGFTITGGTDTVVGGAGVLVSGSSLVIENCVIMENNLPISGALGAGVLVTAAGTLRVEDSVIVGNTSLSRGAGIAASGAILSVDACTFEANIANGANGGGLHVTGSIATIENSVFIDNQAVGASGGGISFQLNAAGSVTNSTFIGNRASSGSGGGIACRDNSSPMISDCVFENNSASSGTGGAILVRGASSPIIERCVITDSSATSGSGGAIGVRDANSFPTVRACIISDTNCPGSAVNVRDSARLILDSTVVARTTTTPGNVGAAIQLQTSAPSIVSNCTLVDNFGGGIYALSTTASTISNTVIRRGTAPVSISGPGAAALVVAFSNVEGGWPGTQISDADPLFADATNGNYKALAGSPLIDAGSNPLSEAGPASLDVSGLPRFIDDSNTLDTGVPGGAGGALVIDIGAHEFQSSDACLADYNGTGEAGDILDFLDFFDDFGACEGQPGPCGAAGDADVNGDTLVDILDFLDFLDSFGTGC